MERKHKAHFPHIEIKAAGDDEHREFTAKITSHDIDRDGEVLVPSGMVTSDFDLNPTVFWNHNYDDPIAMAETPFHRVKEGDTTTAWVAKASMNPHPIRDGGARPDLIHNLMKTGRMRGVSVGFIPIESRPASANDRKAYGSDVKRVYSKWKLLEFSVTPLPANQMALIETAKGFIQKGLASPADIKAVCGVDVDVSCAATEIDPDSITNSIQPRTMLLPLYEQTPSVVIEPRDQLIERTIRIKLAKKFGRSYL